jgi:Flp pilus assembly protein TadG
MVARQIDQTFMTTTPNTVRRFRFRPFTRRRGGRGVAAAELAVCLPVVVLLVIATLEACSAVFLKQSLTVAAYEGVRTAIVPSATSTSIQTTCNQILKDRRVQGGKVTVSPSNIASLNPGDYVDVTITAPCASNSVVPLSFYRGRNMTAKASMMIEF